MTILKRKLRSFFSVLSYIFKGEFAIFLYYFSGYFPSWLFSFNSGYIMTASSLKIPARKYSRFSFYKAESEDLPEIRELTGVSLFKLQQRLSYDDWCIITKDRMNNNKIITVMWVHTGNCYIRGYGLKLDIADNSAYIYGGMSMPVVRVTGAFIIGLKMAIDMLREKNITKLYILNDSWNKNMYNNHLRLGYQLTARVTFIKILGLKLNIFYDYKTKKPNVNLLILEPKGTPVI